MLISKTRMYQSIAACAVAVALAIAACAAFAAPSQAWAASLQSSGLASQASSYQAVTSSYGYITGITNGDYSYYVSNYALYREDNATNTSTKVKSLSKKSSVGPNSWSLAGVYKDNIYLNMSKMNQIGIKVYRYNIKSGKLSKVLNKCTILEQSGKYFVGNTRPHTDVSYNTYVVYKASANGKLKKVKTLAKHGIGLTAVNGKLYFAQSSDKNLSKKVKLYRSNFNGGAKKKLGGPWKGGKYTWSKSVRGQVYISNVTETSCNVTFTGSKIKYYLYTYKTKKLKHLRTY